MQIRRLVFAAAAALLFVSTAFAASSTIVISQVYGGAGCTTAGCSTYKNDYIELFNRGTSAVTLSGWSVQYAAATGTSWQVTSLANFTLQPGQYFLVAEGSGANGVNNVPTPDTSGTINMSATSAKVALVSSTVGLSGACPSGGSIVDFVGYGTTANCFEGAAAAPAPSTSNAVFRAGGGCTETDSNSADFAAAAASPRNSATATHPCGGVVVNNPPTITPPANPITTVSQNAAPFTVSLTGSDDGNVYNWSATPGAGISSVSVTNGQTSATATFTVTLQNGFSGPATFTASLSDNVNPAVTQAVNIQVSAVNNPPTITAPANPITTVPQNSAPFTVSLTGSDDGGIYNWSATPGLGVTSVSVTAGQNTSNATFTVTVQSGFSGTAAFTASLSDNVNPAVTQGVNIAVALTSTVKISQVYGGGGNSGSTYTNDFIELYNQGSTPVSLDGWSVQATSAAGTDWTTNKAPTLLSGTIQPGHYYLIQESQGSGGTTVLPAADATGVIMLSATNAKVALVAGTATLSGSCPTGANIVDFVGYGSANCFEGAAVPVLSNTTAAVRKGNGCIDTDNNFNDFVVIGPIPRNSGSPVNTCGGNSAQPSGLGTASPASLEATGSSVLMVAVTPATTPPSTGLAVNGDLTSIGGSASQQFYDDGTHGDATAGDNVFSFRAEIAFGTTTGAKSIVGTITDAEGRTATAPITLTVQSPTCGVERWAVKTGTDPDAGSVNTTNPDPAEIANLGAIPAPDQPTSPPYAPRFAPTEDTVYLVNATMTLYKKETDVDYHIVLQDNANPVHTLIAEIPSPACVGNTSPFGAAVTQARATFDAHLTATPFFQSVTLPVQVKGVGFFDFIHGQAGVAPNGIELHPVLEINFTRNTTGALTSSANPSQYHQSVTITAAVSNGGTPTPTGNVTFSDGGTPLRTTALDSNGQATFTTSSLSVGSHSLAASYEGDSTSAPSTSAPLTQVVNKADQQIINFATIGGKTFGDADFAVNATATSSLPVAFSIVSGPATITGNMVHITAAGDVKIRASQSGDDNYNAAADVDQTFTVAKATPTILISGGPFTYDATPKSATASATGLGGVPIAGSFGFTYNGSATSPTNAGTYAVVASFTSADTNYADTSKDGSILVKKAMPIVSVSGGPFTYDGTAKVAIGKASGVGDVNVNGSFAFTYNGFPAAPVNAGTYTVAATFSSGDNNYADATGGGSITINRAKPAVTVNGGPFTYDNTAKAATVSATGINNVAVPGSFAITYNGTATLPVNAGTYAVIAMFTSGDSNYMDAVGTGSLIVNKAMPVITVSGGPFTYDTTPKTATATATGIANVTVAGTFTFMYNGSATPPANPGTYAVVASFASADGNYSNTSGTGTISITGLRDSLQTVLVALTKLRDTTPRKQDVDKLDDAIKHLATGVDPELWLDSIRGTADDGNGIFTETKNASIAILALLNDAKSTVPAATLQPLLNTIVRDDRVLALTAINDAVARGANAKSIDKARAELASGDNDIAAGRYESGFEHDRNAWSFATKA